MALELSTLIVSALTLLPANNDSLEVTANELATRLENSVLGSAVIENGVELPALPQDSASA